MVMSCHVMSYHILSYHVPCALCINVMWIRMIVHALRYSSTPRYLTSQPRFVNACIRVFTDMQPEELLQRMKSIEK